MRGRAWLLCLVALLAKPLRAETPQADEMLRVKALAEIPHDPTAYTQGLLWHEGLIYESTGRYGRSDVRRVDPSTGQVLLRRKLDASLFGEGLALAGDRLVQLTWKAGLATVYDLASLEPIDQWTYDGEGWGLAFDGERLILSDGTAVLRFYDPQDFHLISDVTVTLHGKPQAMLNELEWVDGALYANVYGEDWIARIDPATGAVTATIDASGLVSLTDRLRGAEVLNGIAWDPVAKTFWITGKYWPKMFQVVFEPIP